MTTKARFCIVLGVGCVLAACAHDRGAHEAPADSGATGPAAAGAMPATAFVDGTFELRVERAWDGVSGDLSQPADPLPETAYQPDARGTTYRVVVGANRTRVTIGSEPLTGELTDTTETQLSYDLTDGAFAGGRFVVSSAGDDGLQGELTLYGSGRPIVKSERGPIVRVR